MQAGLAAAQEKLASQTVATEGAGGKLKVTATCDGNLTELVIDPSIIDPSDSEFLQDLLLQTINAAIAKGKETAAAEMKKLTGGHGPPSRHGPLTYHHRASAQKTQTSGGTTASVIRGQPPGNSAGRRLSVPVGHRRHHLLDRFGHDGLHDVTAHLGMLPHLLLPGAYCMAGLRFPDRPAWRHYLVCVRHRHYGLSSSHFQNGNGVLQNAAGSGCPANQGSHPVRGVVWKIRPLNKSPNSAQTSSSSRDAATTTGHSNSPTAFSDALPTSSR